MCGIAGIFGKVKDNLPCWAEQLSSKIIHRGPDDFGYFGIQSNNRGLFSKNSYELQNSPFILAHRRLSIIDLNERSHQPMMNTTNRYVITYNGEIYNYEALKIELENLGAVFKTNSDTEVIVNGYAYWKDNIVHKLRGMFAFVIIDIKENYAFFARDHFGIKPLYYSSSKTFFAFSSEIKSLMSLPWINSKANLELVNNFVLFDHVSYDYETFIKSIFQLPPASYGRLDLNGNSYNLIIKKFWLPSKQLATHVQTKEEIYHKFKSIFLESVHLHMESDVPVAANLSGGMDSSSIVMAMNQNWLSSNPIQTFSYYADKIGVDEKKWIDLVTSQTNSENHIFQLTHHQVSLHLDDIIYAQDEPFGSTSIVAQYFLYQHINKHNVKVVLDGQGADEILGGYHTYLSVYALNLLLNGNIKDCYNIFKVMLGRKHPGFLVFLQRILKTFLQGSSFLKYFLAYFSSPYIYKSFIKENLCLEKEITLNKSIFQQYLHRMLHISNLPLLLRFCDRNSMNFSVENRVPFLIPELCNFIFSLPYSFLFSKNFETKSILRQSMTNIVPEEILNRQDKVAFQTPQFDWLLHSNEWVQENLEHIKKENLDFINIKNLENDYKKLLSNHVSPSNSFFRVMSLIAWKRIHKITF